MRNGTVSAGKARCKAFTLMEMLLAVAVSGMILAAASFLIVGLSEIWARRTQMDSFNEHADGVAGFLQKSLDESMLRHQPSWVDKDSSGASSGEKGKGEESDSVSEALANSSSGKWTGGVDMARIDEDDSLEKPKLHFAFFHMPALLGADAPDASAGVEAWLIFEKGKGLAIVWKDTRSVQNRLVSDDKDLLRASMLSPHVSEVKYVYLREDERRWRDDDEPLQYSGSYISPTLIILSFDVDGRRTERTIVVPDKAREMPLF